MLKTNRGVIDMPPFFGPIVMLVNSIYSSASLSAS